MSDIRFNQWLHQSGTGGVSQVASGAVGVGTTNPLADFYVRGDAQITGILTAGHIAMGSSITFGDDDRAYFGDGTDLQIYHNSGNSYIQNSGSGSGLLYIDATQTIVRNRAGNEDIAKFVENGAVHLYFNNGEKFTTTNTGAVVTGILTATSFSGGSGSTSSIDAGILDLKTGGNIRLRFASGGEAQFRGDTNPIASFDRGSANSTNVSWKYLGAARGQVSSTSGEFRLTADGTIPMTFYSNSNERLRITSTGRVGINETSPDVDLHIKNTNPAIYLEGTNGSGRQHKIWSAGTNSESLQFTSGNLLYNADVHYFRATNESTEYARITSTGNLKLPDDAKLQFGGALSSGDGDLQIFHQTSGSINQIQSTAGNNLRVRQLGNGGALYLAATNVYFQNHDNNQTYLQAQNNGSVTLNHSGNARARTDANGFYLSRVNTFSNPNNTGSETLGAMLDIGGNIHLQEVHPIGAYTDRCDLVLNTNSGYGLGLSDKIRITAGGQVLVHANTGWNESQALLSIATDAATGANMLSDSSAIYNHNNPAFIHVQNRYNTGTGQEAGIIFHSRSSHNGSWAIYGKRTGSSYLSDLIFRNRTGGSSSAERFKIGSNGWTYHNTTSNGTTNGLVDKRYNWGSDNNLNFGMQCTTRQRFSIWEHRQIGRTNERTAQMSCGENGSNQGIVYMYSSTANADVTGGVNLVNGATSWSATSDIRLKNKTGDILNALEDINKIEPIRFTWKYGPDNNPHVGVSAQSVENVVPEAIERGVDVERQREGDETEYMQVRYTELIPLSIAAIKELKAEVESLKAEIASLKSS